MGAFRIAVDEREELFELVEHDEQLGVGIGQEPGRDAGQTELVELELLEERRGRVHADPEQRGLELP